MFLIHVPICLIFSMTENYSMSDLTQLAKDAALGPIRGKRNCYAIKKRQPYWMVSLSLVISYHDVDGLVQDCSNSIANALDLLQSCTKPLIWSSSAMINFLQNTRNRSLITNQLGPDMLMHSCEPVATPMLVLWSSSSLARTPSSFLSCKSDLYLLQLSWSCFVLIYHWLCIFCPYFNHLIHNNGIYIFNAVEVLQSWTKSKSLIYSLRILQW